MVDPVTPAPDPGAALCPWCSAALPPDVTICPSCGASLVADGDPNVPGVTTVATKPIVAEKATTQRRNRLLAWISGEYPEDIPSEAEVQAIAPPDLEVRREMLRLELEAEVANLQAEEDAIRADAALEGQTVDLPEIPPMPDDDAAVTVEDKPPA
jgi:hypothetical protein